MKIPDGRSSVIPSTKRTAVPRPLDPLTGLRRQLSRPNPTRTRVKEHIGRPIKRARVQKTQNSARLSQEQSGVVWIDAYDVVRIRRISPAAKSFRPGRDGFNVAMSMRSTTLSPAAMQLSQRAVCDLTLEKSSIDGAMTF